MGHSVNRFGLVAYGRPRAAAAACQQIRFSALVLFLVTGCSGFVQRTAVTTVADFGVEQLVPYILAQEDRGLSCGAGLAFSSFMASGDRFVGEEGQATMVAFAAAGLCAETELREVALRRARHTYHRQAESARDALIQEERGHRVAADRFLTAYARRLPLVEEDGVSCLTLDESEQALGMLGLTAGLLSIRHDRASGQPSDGALSVPPQVVREAACFDNARWWGWPGSLQAAVWLLVPGSGPPPAEAWDAMERSVAMGDAGGVRLARAVASFVATSRGEDVRLAKLLAPLGSTFAAHPRFALLDREAFAFLQHESDLVWTQKTGHRTPRHRLGTLPGDAASVEDVDEGLLDGL